MANKKLNLNVPLLSIRRTRPRISIGSSSGGSVRSHGCVPFSWEDAPGQPKYAPYDDNDNRDIKVDDEFSDAQTEFSIKEFIDDESRSFVKHIENVLVDRVRFRMQLSEEEESINDDDNDDDNNNIGVSKGCGLVRRFWLTSGGPPCFVALRAIVKKHKKHLVKALTRRSRSRESSHEERDDPKRTWKAVLKDINLGIRQRSRSDKPDKQTRTIYHRLPFPSSPYPNSPCRYPPSREGPVHDSPQRTFLSTDRYSNLATERVVVLPMEGIVSRTTRSRRGGIDEMDPLYSADGAIHAERIFNYNPPILNSPTGSWLWSSGTNRAGNSPNSLLAIQFKSRNNWSRSPSPKVAWEYD